MTHGIGGGWYSSPDGVATRCYLTCLCGWRSEPSLSWSAAGHGLDQHLAAALPPAPSEGHTPAGTTKSTRTKQSNHRPTNHKERPQ